MNCAKLPSVDLVWHVPFLLTMSMQSWRASFCSNCKMKLSLTVMAQSLSLVEGGLLLGCLLSANPSTALHGSLPAAAAMKLTALLGILVCPSSFRKAFADSGSICSEINLKMFISVFGIFTYTTFLPVSSYLTALFTSGLQEIPVGRVIPLLTIVS